MDLKNELKTALNTAFSNLIFSQFVADAATAEKEIPSYISNRIYTASAILAEIIADL